MYVCIYIYIYIYIYNSFTSLTKYQLKREIVFQLIK